MKKDIEVIIKREYKKDRTLGQMTIFVDGKEKQRLFTLELPWLDNKNNISCIPEGEYNVIPNNTVSHPNTYRLCDVPKRSGILIHIANYPKDIKGCIAVGTEQIDLDDDGLLDVANSTNAMKNMWNLINENNFKLIIKS